MSGRLKALLNVMNDGVVWCVCFDRRDAGDRLPEGLGPLYHRARLRHRRQGECVHPSLVSNGTGRQHSYSEATVVLGFGGINHPMSERTCFPLLTADEDQHGGRVRGR